MIIHFKSGTNQGLFACLFRIIEWIYCVKNDENLSLYIDLTDYGCKGNTFAALFQPFQDSQIKIGKPDFNENVKVVQDLPGFCFNNLKFYVADGLTTSSHLFKYVYAEHLFLKSKDFRIFRERLHPYVREYFELESALKKKIDSVIQKMNRQNEQNNYKIGIFVRGLTHFKGYNKSNDQFVSDVIGDIDQIMKTKDERRTTIFLATICEPIVQRLSSSKYNVVFCDIPRLHDVSCDWTALPNAGYNIEVTHSAITDVWCLANCDEIWGSASNLTMFAGCINPSLKINFLPSFENYDCH